MNPYYQDDAVTLYHGDCLELADLWTGADVLVTDPPYGRAWRQGNGMRKINGRPGRHAANVVSNVGIANDHSTEARDAALAAWGDRPAIVFGDLMLGQPSGTKLTAVYAKPADAGLRGTVAGVRRDAEAIYLLGLRGGGIGGRSSIFRTAKSNVGNPSGIVATSGGHPHSKPLDVMEQLLGLVPEGEVADPFAGGGGTLVAAKRAGRRAVGVELDERWCEVIAKRLAQGVLDLGSIA